jgi:hypothetical protein
MLRVDTKSGIFVVFDDFEIKHAVDLTFLKCEPNFGSVTDRPTFFTTVRMKISWPLLSVLNI